MNTAKRSGYTGVWPENNETQRKKIMSNLRVIIALNVATWGCAIPTIHSLCRIWGDLMSMIDNLQYTMPQIMAILKLFLMWRKKKVLLPLLNMIKDDWLKPKTEEERDIMIKRARVARTLTIFEYFIMLLSFCLVVFPPFFGVSIRYLTNKTDTGKLMPLQTYYIYDKNQSPLYEITYALQSFGLVSVASMYTSTDSFLSFLVFHVCGQLENLKARILNLNKYNFERALSNSVQEHIRLIRSINIIDSTFNLMLLGSLLYFSVLFAFYGFLMVTILTQVQDLSVPRLLFIVTVFINTFTHTCLYCVVGEILITQYEGIYHATCEYKWYMLESRKARNLLLILIHSNKSRYLTAGKIFPMTMAMFCNLLKTSASYVTVLLAHQ